MKLKSAFFWRYSIKQKRGQALKRITIAVSALAIAFTALSTGYVKDFGENQEALFKAISKRELAVAKRWDPNYPGSVLRNETPSLTEEQIRQLQQIDGVEKSGPVSLFWYRSDFCDEALEIDYSNLSIEDFTAYISYRNQFGKTGKVPFCVTEFDNAETGEHIEPGEDAVRLGYYVASYFSYESMDLKSDWIDRSVSPEEGIYVSSDLFEAMGLDKTDLENLQFTIDVAIPTKRMIDTTTLFDDDVAVDSFDSASDWCVSRQITLPVRGVLDLGYVGPPICAPYAVMAQYIEENRIDKIPDQYYEKNPEARDWVKDTYDWRPWAYYLLMEDVADLDAIKAAVEKIDPDLSVIYEFQDRSAVMEAVDNTQKIVLYISVAILAVILLLSAVVHVSIIDRRKYEFAFLRANGLTKKELRKLVLCDTALQAVATFLAAFVFALVAHLLLTTSTGGFVFDGMTVLWLAVISVISVILPSVIALVLTNRYEPDAILRN